MDSNQINAAMRKKAPAGQVYGACSGAEGKGV